MSDSSDHPPYSAVDPEPWKSVFVDVANGTPDEPTKAGLLALVRHGKVVWNAWRNAYPCRVHRAINVVTTVGPKVDLRGHVFQDNVNFAEFLFGDDADFEGVHFRKTAIFAGAQFGDMANFGFTRFEGPAVFLGAQFGDDARFVGAKFDDQTTFKGAQCGGKARFSGAQFGSHANFEGTQFGDLTQFGGVSFNGLALFGGLDWASLGYIYGEFLDDRRAWANLRGLDPQAFGRIDFGGAKFLGSSDFSNRHFTGTTNFGLSGVSSAVHRSSNEHGNVLAQIIAEVNIPSGLPTFFEIPPAFHNSTLHQDTTFQGAIFPKKAHGNEMCARAYRTLKLAFAQQHAVREEQHFFKLEMAEEAALDTGAKRWLYRVYKEVAGYGFSLIRPFAWGLCLTGLLAIVYGVLMWGSGTTPGFAIFGKAPIDWQLTTQWVQFVLINLLPLPGFDETLKELRSTLFGNSGWWPLLATIAEAMHKICVLLAVFLIGLALRNLFKLK
jgi:uncharacterized protein YjbI with pentapeptide repeats